MEWVKDFYKKQSNFLKDCYLCDVDDFAKEKVSIIEKILDKKITSILDLGAGGGQNAIAMTLKGYSVTMIELLEEFTTHAKKLAEEHNQDLKIIQGDFYKVKLDQVFDLITYWDGFGIGTDEEQRLILKRIASWIKNDGIVLIEVYTPWYAGYSEGKEMSFGDVKRRYGFDPLNSRWLDNWWKVGDEDQVIKQSLRCYSPADFKLLIEGTGLKLDKIEPCLQYDGGERLYPGIEKLGKSITYLAKMVKA